VLSGAARLLSVGADVGSAFSSVASVALWALTAAIPLGVLSRMFGGTWETAASVVVVAVATIDLVVIWLQQLSRSSAGHPNLKYPLRWLTWDAALLIVLFGFAYTGISNSEPKETRLALADGIYLSAITITTTGYGDVLPPRAARPLAMLEALLGYALLGTWVATLFQRVTTGARKEDDSNGDGASS